MYIRDIQNIVYSRESSDPYQLISYSSQSGRGGGRKGRGEGGKWGEGGGGKAENVHHVKYLQPACTVIMDNIIMF